MPAVWPNYKWNLYDFKVKTTDDIKQELRDRKLDYRDVISITWIGPQVDGYDQVFYGLKQT
ncbi:hypothetical protein KA005_25040, partial [bacterium]|nr:hypothetical protein [bacterium]